MEELKVTGGSSASVLEKLAEEQTKRSKSVTEQLVTFRKSLNSVKNEDKLAVVHRFIESFGANDVQFCDADVDVWVSVVQDLLEWARIKEFRSREDEEYDAKDFGKAKERIAACFQVLVVLFRKLSKLSEVKDSKNCSQLVAANHDNSSHDTNGLDTTFLKKFFECVVVDIMVLCFSTMHETLWTTETVNKDAKLVSQSIVELTGCENMTDLLCGNTENCKCPLFPKGIYKMLLQKLQVFLTKERWKRNPAMKAAFKQSLFLIKMPEMGEHISDVFSTILLLVDDYMTVNKVEGLQCLCHLIKTTSSAELRWYGRADVLFDALFHQLYSREEPVLDISLPALLDVLKIVEVSPSNADHPRLYGRYDKVFRQILTNMETENLLVLRRIYAKNLPQFIKSLGITTVRHNKRLLRVFESYLEQYDGPLETARLFMLKALQVYIQSTWPRIPIHCDRILKFLLKFVYDIWEDESLTSQTVKQELVTETVACMLLLKQVCCERVVELLNAVKEDRLNEKWHDCVVDVIEAKVTKSS